MKLGHITMYRCILIIFEVFRSLDFIHIIYNIFLSALIYLFILDISFYFIEWKNEQTANSITVKVVLEVGVYSQEWEP